jgi:alanine dehydrogenase
MLIGVPKERRTTEHRVALTPYAVSRLAGLGHTIMIQTDAGLESRFTDEEYERAGAQVVYSREEAYKRADVVCKVGVIRADDLDLLKERSVVCAFHHLAVSPRSVVEQLMDLEMTVIGYELIQDAAGNHPVLLPFSEMAGQMAVHIAANCLTIRTGGRGILLGTVPGIPAPTVLILGAGTVGRTAARYALASGARVIVLDEDIEKLRTVSSESRGEVETFVAGADRLDKLTAVADVVIGAVLIPGAKAPFLVTEGMVNAMKKGSVIVDLSIDQGGCVETSRPTTLDKATYVVHDVVHYCVPNMTSNIARTASRALADALQPYLLKMEDKGLAGALRDDPGLGKGVYMYQGQMVNQQIATMLGIEAIPLNELTNGDGTL